MIYAQCWGAEKISPICNIVHILMDMFWNISESERAHPMSYKSLGDTGGTKRKSMVSLFAVNMNYGLTRRFCFQRSCNLGVGNCSILVTESSYGIR